MSGLIDVLYPPFVGGRIALGLLLLRCVAGFALFFHGLQKMAGGPFGWMGPEGWAPPLLQFLAAFAECFGGLALVVGLLTPLAALGIAATMAVATFAVHVAGGDPFVRLRGPEEAEALLGMPMALVRLGGPGGSYELASIFLVIAVTLLLTGPGRLSLDALLFGRQRAVGAAEPARRASL